MRIVEVHRGICVCLRGPGALIRGSSVAAVAFLHLSAPTAAAQDAPVYLAAPDSAAHVYRSGTSGFADAARLVVRDSVAWGRVWATLHVGAAQAPPPPPIDFRREIVIVAALGGRTAAGYAITIDTVRRAGEEIEAVVRTFVPGERCGGGVAFVEPADAVRVPRSERAVTFTERRQALEHCGARGLERPPR